MVDELKPVRVQLRRENGPFYVLTSHRFYLDLVRSQMTKRQFRRWRGKQREQRKEPQHG